MLVTLSAALPVLLSVTDCAALVVFSSWLPKLKFVADKLTMCRGSPRAGQADGLRAARNVVGNCHCAGTDARGRGRERDADGAVGPCRDGRAAGVGLHEVAAGHDAGNAQRDIPGVIQRDGLRYAGRV